MMTIDKETLAARIAEVALLRGEFTLRSGRTSSYYLDKYLFSTQPDVLVELAELFAGVRATTLIFRKSSVNITFEKLSSTNIRNEKHVFVISLSQNL